MRLGRALLTGVAIAMLMVGTAHASPPAPEPAVSTAWTDRLPPSAVSSYLRESDRRVLVVPAGTSTPDLAAVAKATMVALRDSGRFDLVMDPSGLGQIGQLSDQEIVTKAAGSPVTAVLIVRVFGEGAQASVVGTSYALDGSVIAAFSVSPGASLTVRADQTDGSGLSESTVGTISEVIHDNGGSAERPPNETELEYLERFLHFRYMVQFNVYTGQGTAHQTGQVLRGIDNVPLSDYEMLEYIGQPDLARRHRTRQRLKIGLMASGGALGFGPLVAGAILFGIAYNENCYDDYASFNCQQSAVVQPAGIGLIVVGSVFTTGFIVGAALPTLVDNKKKIDLVNGYNQSLRRELLLPDDVEDRLLSSTERRDRRLRRARMLATWRLSPTGTGLSFTGRF